MVKVDMCFFFNGPIDCSSMLRKGEKIALVVSHSSNIGWVGNIIYRRMAVLIILL